MTGASRARAFGFACLAVLPLLSGCASVIPDTGSRPSTATPPPATTRPATGTPVYQPRPSETGTVAARPIPATPNPPLAAPPVPAGATTAAESGVIAGPEFNELGVSAEQATAALKAFRISCPSVQRRATRAG